MSYWDPTQPHPWLHACRGPIFLNDAAETTAWRARVHAARKNQRVPIAVAPNLSFTGPNKRVYNEGDVVDERDFERFELDRLEALQMLIRLTPDELSALSSVGARYRVSEGQAILTRHGIVAEGGRIEASHFEGGLARIKELIERGVISETPEADRK